MTMLDLASFDISSVNGFLPTHPPARTFRDLYYLPWDNIAHNLPALLSNHQLRQAVHELACLSTDKLVDLSEWKRAYVVLGFILHGYVWEEEPAAERVPAPLAIPYLHVCAKLKIAPVASYACLCLWNYSVVDSGKALADPDNLDCLVSFTGSRGESWFYLMSVAIEAQGGSLVEQTATALQNPTVSNVLQALTDLTTTLGKMTATLGRMSEHLDPGDFYNVIRPWIMGFRNATARGLPNGIIYETGTGTEQHQQYVGGSNGQTSLLPFLDVVLGIEHSKANQDFLTEMGDYMPGRHVEFIKAVRNLPSLKDHVTDDPSNTELMAAYDKTIASLKGLRDKHVIVVTRYIVVPGRKVAEATGAQPQGSAGASPIPLLQSMKKETAKSRLSG